MSHDEDPGASPRPLPSSLVPRWLAGVILAAILAAGALSAWLVVNGDLHATDPLDADGARIPGTRE